MLLSWLVGSLEIAFLQWGIHFNLETPSKGGLYCEAAFFNPFRHTEESKNQRHLLYLFETWLELMQNEAEMLQHSKNIEEVLKLFNEVKGCGAVHHQKYHAVCPPLEALLGISSALERYDQSRKQDQQAPRG